MMTTTLHGMLLVLTTVIVLIASLATTDVITSWMTKTMALTHEDATMLLIGDDYDGVVHTRDENGNGGYDDCACEYDEQLNITDHSEYDEHPNDNDADRDGQDETN